MSGVDTHVPGEPATLDEYAAWVRGRAARAVRGAAASMAQAVDGSAAWTGLAAAAFRADAAQRGASTAALAARVEEVAEAVAEHARTLRQVQAVADAVRRSAAAAGLEVNGTVVREPAASAGLDPLVGPGAAARLAREVERREAYGRAESTMRLVRELLRIGEREVCVAVDDYRGLVGDQWAIAGAQLSLDAASAAAAAKAAEIAEPAAARAPGEAAEVRDAARRATQTGGAALFLAGVAWDLRQGESPAQAVASNAAGAAGWSGGVAATSMAFAAAGTSVGPVGTVAGLAVGATVGIFASGAVDRAWNERGGAGDAVEGGVKAVGDTAVALGTAVADGATHVADEVGEGAEDIADAAGDAWSWVEERVG